MENNVEVVNHAVGQVQNAGYRDESTADMLKAALVKGEKQVKVFPTAKQYSDGLAVSELVLNFSDKTGKYYLNQINMSVTPKANGLVKYYSFRLDKDHKWTQKQAFNMLMGRAICKNYQPKEGEAYEAWLKFDFNKLVDVQKKVDGASDNVQNSAKENIGQKTYHMDQWHPKWGFNIDEVVEKFNVLDPKTNQAPKDLIADLKRGNLQPVIFVTSDGKQVPGFMEAAPAHKSVNNYDEKGWMFPKDHELSGYYKGNRTAMTNQPNMESIPKGAQAQEHKQTSETPAPKTRRNRKTEKQGTGETKSSRKRGPRL